MKLEKIESLLCLSLNNCQLTTLENFPQLTELIRLEIMDNKFPGSSLTHLSGLVGLQSLSLANNDISEYEQLQVLSDMKNLVQMDLSECAISEKTDYRKRIFEMFTNLHILDNADAEGRPFEYSGDSDLENVENAFEDDDEDDDEDDEDEEVVDNQSVSDKNEQATAPVTLKKTKEE